jgi:hypothetical protein
MLTPRFYQQLELASRWFTVFKYANKLTSSNSFPMSAYLPTVQAIRNGINQVLNCKDADFSVIMGAEVKAAVIAMVRVRFNMDGVEPTGAKVGLLDQNQVWAHMVDPYKHQLSPAVHIQGGLPSHMRDMCDFFYPVDNVNHSTEQQNINKVTRAEARREFSKLHSLQGNYGMLFDFAVPAALSDEDSMLAQQGLTLEAVSAWVDSSGRHHARLQFFSPLPSTEFFETFVTPLLSIRTTGSIAVERVAKPLKNKVMTKQCNKLGLEKAETALRLGLNLRYL